MKPVEALYALLLAVRGSNSTQEVQKDAVVDILASAIRAGIRLNQVDLEQIKKILPKHVGLDRVYWQVSGCNNLSTLSAIEKIIKINPVYLNGNRVRVGQRIFWAGCTRSVLRLNTRSLVFNANDDGNDVLRFSEIEALDARIKENLSSLNNYIKEMGCHLQQRILDTINSDRYTRQSFEANMANKMLEEMKGSIIANRIVLSFCKDTKIEYINNPEEARYQKACYDEAIGVYKFEFIKSSRIESNDDLELVKQVISNYFDGRYKAFLYLIDNLYFFRIASKYSEENIDVQHFLNQFPSDIKPAGKNIFSAVMRNTPFASWCSNVGVLIDLADELVRRGHDISDIKDHEFPSEMRSEVVDHLKAIFTKGKLKALIGAPEASGAVVRVKQHSM